MAEADFSGLEIITPKLTDVEPDEIRVPDDGEVLLAHGVDKGKMYLGKIGELAIFNPQNPARFPFRYPLIGLYKGPWHIDPQHIQLHLTTNGKCNAQLAGVVTGGAADAVPYHSIDKKMEQKFKRSAIDVDLGEGDLLVFSGGRCFLPAAHRFRNLTRDRISYQFMHWPGKTSRFPAA